MTVKESPSFHRLQCRKPFFFLLESMLNIVIISCSLNCCMKAMKTLSLHYFVPIHSHAFYLMVVTIYAIFMLILFIEIKFACNFKSRN